MIARQYATGFQDVLEQGAPMLRTHLDANLPLESSIIRCFLGLLARYPDSLIQRKAGLAEAEKVSRRAALALRGSETQDGPRAWKELDAWLREKGTHRNPGTTADLVTACLFVLLREGVLELPCQKPWSAVPPGEARA
jgi:triphosphoribosyl-dephospho-CoA synthase